MVHRETVPPRKDKLLTELADPYFQVILDALVLFKSIGKMNLFAAPVGSLYIYYWLILRVQLVHSSHGILHGIMIDVPNISDLSGRGDATQPSNHRANVCSNRNPN